MKIGSIVATNDEAFGASNKLLKASSLVLGIAVSDDVLANSNSGITVNTGTPTKI
jgi:hypothetical protein